MSAERIATRSTPGRIQIVSYPLLQEKVDNSEDAITELMGRVVDLAGEAGRALWIAEPTLTTERCSSVSC